LTGFAEWLIYGEERPDGQQSAKADGATLANGIRITASKVEPPPECHGDVDNEGRLLAPHSLSQPEQQRPISTSGKSDGFASPIRQVE
jgi:hypothetical protein